MANAAGMIRESIWRDDHWRTLSRSAQALYMQLLSQKELDCAGVLPLQPQKWANGCDELTVEQVWADLDELQDNRFVFYDTDTYEALIRTHVRNSNVMKVPNMRKSACRSALLLGSEKLRPILAAELHATGDPECVATALEINPSGTLTVTLPELLITEPFRNPSGTLPEPTGVGMGMGTGVTLVTTHLGEAPPQFCSSHPNGTNKSCFACGQARQRFAKWEADARAAESAARLAALDNCPDCHGTNLIEVGDAQARKCDHRNAPGAAHA